MSIVIYTRAILINSVSMGHARLPEGHVLFAFRSIPDTLRFPSFVRFPFGSLSGAEKTL